MQPMHMAVASSERDLMEGGRVVPAWPDGLRRPRLTGSAHYSADLGIAGSP
ncbi:hypothetical protein [Paracoccus sp. PARArs4]|uniref:hypothetical protein n=1 Tax=Paracoccus sp. PARArs4 TaxID=2853442 RepID=UPI0024A77102|nr:hypothetical protein [Paracoccus sp. PARArs4]